MAGERPGHILQATALVNEAYMRLVDWKDVRGRTAHISSAWRRRSCAASSSTPRGRAIAPSAAAAQLHVSLSEAADVPAADSVDLVALDDALQQPGSARSRGRAASSSCASSAD